jgi:hypothetical protein
MSIRIIKRRTGGYVVCNFPNMRHADSGFILVGIGDGRLDIIASAALWSEEFAPDGVVPLMEFCRNDLILLHNALEFGEIEYETSN